MVMVPLRKVSTAQVAVGDSRGELDDAEQAEHDGRLARAGPTYDTDLLAALDVDGDAPEDRRKACSVAHDDVVDFDRARRRPVRRGTRVVDHGGRLLLELLAVVDETLDRVHVVLDLRRLAHHPRKGLRDREDVGEDETGLGGRDGVACSDADEGDEDSEDRTTRVEAESEPTLVDDGEEVCSVLDVLQEESALSSVQAGSETNDEDLVLLEKFGTLAVRPNRGESLGPSVSVGAGEEERTESVSEKKP